MNITTIVLVPSLWMTALCWEHWVKHYSDKGYCVVARSWPGMEGGIEQLRRDPSSFASLGLTEVVDHYEQIIRELETPPIIIGHGFGGLVTQILLDRGWGAAGVAVAPAPVKGVRRLPLANLKIAFSALGNPFNSHGTTSLTPKQFRYAFANTLTETQSLAAFERYMVPAPNRILLQAALANFTPHAAASVNSLVKANFDLYQESKAETDYKEFPSEAHFTLLRETKIADYVLGWALYRSNGSKLPAVSNHTDGWSVQLSA